ncbi:MAG: glycosyltransferase family 39 protein [Deltaproteobacteria bacterium]|nr:glycosyltransferase family 39 protein [Deltaproteobacteria bacterium]
MITRRYFRRNGGRPSGSPTRQKWGAPVYRGRPHLFIAILTLGALLRVPAFFTPLLSDDEAIYATTADAMQRGDALYRDVVDHKPPAIYDIYRAAFAVFGQYQTHGAHLFVLLAVLATAWALCSAARRIRGDARDGDIAALLWVVFSTTWHDYDALAANCELFLVLPQAWAFAILLRAKKIGSFALAGFLVGLSATLKYQGFTFLGVIAFALLLDVVQHRVTILRAIGLYIVAKTASVAPLGLYAMSYALAGNLDAAVFWFIFNFTYISAGFTGFTAAFRFLMRLAMIGGVAIAAYGFGFLGAIHAARNGVSEIRTRTLTDTTRAQLLAVAWFLTSAIALIPGGRYFGHYFHLILPAVCVLAAIPLRRFWAATPASASAPAEDFNAKAQRRKDPRNETSSLGVSAPLRKIPAPASAPAPASTRRALIVFLIAAPALTFFLLSTALRPWAQSLDDPQPPYETVAARVRTLTFPDDRIFVWGNSPQMYVFARRPMGSRFSFCNYLTGEASSDKSASDRPTDKGRGLDDAWTMLFDDLDRKKPRLFIDAARAGWDGYAAFPIANYPRLATYLEEHYRLIERVEGVAIYLRNDLSD